MFTITKENFQSIRENGIGSNFKVLNPADGYRKDDRLWFGTCAECGETVTNSALKGEGWMHSIHSVQVMYAPALGREFELNSYKKVNYCPKVGQ